LPPVLPIMAKELRLSHTESGLLETAYLIGYIIIKLPSGFLVNRFGSKKVLTASMVGYGIANLLVGWAVRFPEIFVLRLLVGVFQGVHLPVANALLSDRFDERQRRVIGFNESGPNVGNTLAFPLTVSILSMYGWRYAFIFLSLPAFILSLFTLLLMKEETRENRIYEEVSDEVKLWDYLGILTPLAISHGLYNIVLRTTFTFTPSFLVEFRDINVGNAGLIAMVLPLSGIFAKISSGFIAERYGPERSICSAIFLSGIFLYMLLVLPMTVLLPLNLLILGLTLYSFSPIIYSSTTEHLPSKLKSMGLGVVTMFGNIIGALSTGIIGVLIDTQGYYYAFTAISLVTILSTFLINRLMKN